MYVMYKRMCSIKVFMYGINVCLCMCICMRSMCVYVNIYVCSHIHV